MSAPTDTDSTAAEKRHQRPVYLDVAATTPLLPEVLEEVERYLRVEFGNDGSRTHEYGAAARRRVVAAREEVAALAAARPDEVIFTSGATEANNIALLGLAAELKRTGRRHIVTSALEHKAVLEPVGWLRRRGFSITLVGSDETGRADVEQMAAAVVPETGLVSLMAVNNETGVVQHIDRLGELLPPEVYLHVDAAQGLGKEFERIASPRIDLISGSGHKLFAPKGIGVLIARRRGFRRLPLEPLMAGGGQQRGLRPGTIPVHLAAGFGTAARLAIAERRAREQRNRAFRERMLTALAPLSPVLNGDPEASVAHIVNLSIPGIDGEAALVATKDLIAISNGSACTSQAYEPSHVLAAMGLGDERIAGALRISWWHRAPEPDWLAIVQRLQGMRR